MLIAAKQVKLQTLNLTCMFPETVPTGPLKKIFAKGAWSGLCGSINIWALITEISRDWLKLRTSSLCQFQKAPIIERVVWSRDWWRYVTLKDKVANKQIISDRGLKAVERGMRCEWCRCQWNLCSWQSALRILGAYGALMYCATN